MNISYIIKHNTWYWVVKINNVILGQWKTYELATIQLNNIKNTKKYKGVRYYDV